MRAGGGRGCKVEEEDLTEAGELSPPRRWARGPVRLGTWALCALGGANGTRKALR